MNDLQTDSADLSDSRTRHSGKENDAVLIRARYPIRPPNDNWRRKWKADKSDSRGLSAASVAKQTPLM